MSYDYTYTEIVKSLKEVGLKNGNNVFSHSNIGFFGKLKDAKVKEDYYKSFKKAFFEVIGKEGTLIVPTFSYSFCWNKEFDSEKTPSECGLFTELLRKDPESIRSEDANFSVCAVGKNANFFTKEVPSNSYGKNSFWERFHKKNGVFCNLNYQITSTFIHYVERVLKVPYRYDKPFEGTIVINGLKEKRIYFHFVRSFNKNNHETNVVKYLEKADKLGMVKTSNLGKGKILVMTSKDMYNLIKKQIESNPAFLINGPL